MSGKAPSIWAKYVFLLAAAALLSSLTILLGAWPMLVLRRSFGRLPYWAGLIVASIVTATGAPFYGLVLAALTVVVGIYVEIEESGGSVFSAASISIVTAIGGSVLAVGLWLSQTNTSLLGELRKQLTPMADRIATVNSGTSITVDAILQQLPSGMVIALMGALVIAIIGADKLQDWIGLARKQVLREDLTQFRAPDAVTYLVVAALAGSFIKHGLPWVEVISLNLLNVLVVLYFFQGLAIAAHAFRVFKVSPIWQGLWYVVLVLQLFLAVSLLGFADFWLEFRDRMSGKPAPETKKNFLN